MYIPHSDKPRGFTILELMVVLSIIGIVLAIVLPALMHARESARRATCQMRLAQIGRAVHNHYDAYRRFPSGSPGPYLTGGSKVLSSHSYFVQVMPYLELESAAREVTDHAPINFMDYWTRTPRYGTLTIPVGQCPSDPVPFGLSFRGSTGASCFAYKSVTAPDGYGGDGAFPYKFGFRDAHFPKGLSNCVGVTEKRKSRRSGGPDRTADTWLTGLDQLVGHSVTSAEVLALCRSAPPSPPDYFNEAGHSWAFSGYLFTAYNHAAPPNSGIWDCNLGVRDGRVGSFRASSYHRGGVTSMRMDGSVHFVSDTIDAIVWQRLGSREDVEFR